MDWQIIRDAVLAAASTATGVPPAEVQLETDRGGFAAISTGRRLRVDFDERAPHPDYLDFLDLGSGLEPVVRGDREIGATFRFFADDHRVSAGWSHAAASQLAARLRLPHVSGPLSDANLALLRVEDVLDEPSVVIDDRQQSVASLRAVWLTSVCERASNVPAADPLDTAYWDRADAALDAAAGPVDIRRAAVAPGAVPDALAAVPWAALWIGGDVDVAGGRHLALSGAAAADETAGALTVPAGAGTAECDDREAGQLLPGRAVVLAASGAVPGATAELLSRYLADPGPGQSRGWRLSVEPDGALTLALSGSTGDASTATAAGAWDGSRVVVVLWTADGATYEMHAGGASVALAAPGLVASAGPALTLGAHDAFTAAEQAVELLGEVETDDPAQLRADVLAALS